MATKIDRAQLALRTMAALLAALAWVSCAIVAGLDGFVDESTSSSGGGAGGGPTGGGGVGTGGDAEGGGGPVCDPAECNGDVDDCHTQACADDFCVLQTKGPGTACDTPAGFMCDVNGVCVECLDTPDCNVGEEVCLDNVCVLATCDDSSQNGDETGFNCGGSCPPCDPGEGCVNPSDCTTGWCNASSACQAAASCAALLAVAPPTSGPYVLDVDGSAGIEPPFEAYCDMDYGPGGWTLGMKLSDGDTFEYKTSHWITASIHNATNPAPNTGVPGDDAKYPAFNLVEGTEMRLEWLRPAGHSFTHTIGNNASLLDVFSGPKDEIAGADTDACHGPLLMGQPGYVGSEMQHGEAKQMYGLNITAAAKPTSGEMRWGFASENTETTWYKAHHAMGVYGQGLKWAGQSECNGCDCYGTQKIYNSTAANLWIR